MTLGAWFFGMYLFIDCLARIVMAVVDVRGGRAASQLDTPNPGPDQRRPSL